MSNKFIVHFKGLRKEFKNYPIVYTIILIILLSAIFVRVYNVNNNLGFYFDQGRDALVIWNFWKNGDLFLLGPTTGIPGIFSGPWYYWLITPLYILGQGNPVWPAVFLSTLSVIGIYFTYLISVELGNPRAGLFTGVIAAFSYYVVITSRWLTNITPMLLIGPVILWAMIKASQKKAWPWPVIAFLTGMSIQIGSSTEVFNLITVIIFFIWQFRLSAKRRRPLVTKRIFLISLSLFLVSFTPHIIFDILRGGVLITNLINFVTSGSFKLSIWEILKIRLSQYDFLFTSLLLPGDRNYLLPFILGGIWVYTANAKAFLNNSSFKILLLYISVPLVSMIFFQGNFGNVYDYYYSGLYYPWILLFALPFGLIAKNWGGNIVILVFLLIFFKFNTPVLEEFIVKGRTHFTFAHQKKTIEWVYRDAEDKDFNVDVYVPPVIPYAYDYLFKWYPTTSRFAGLRGTSPSQVEERVLLLYTIYELDPPNPQRLEAWLKRQNTIGKVEYEFSFGGITIQRRHRL